MKEKEEKRSERSIMSVEWSTCYDLSVLEMNEKSEHAVTMRADGRECGRWHDR